MSANENGQPAKPDHVSWYDHLVMLLHLAAEIEHALMVQYLFAAYSLGGDGVPRHLNSKVENWRRSILDIAKEEMGHLLTVQNVLRLIGAPASLDRENFPWDAEYYPFPFRLEPLTLESLACYLYAEMPPEEFLRSSGYYRYKRFLERDRDAVRELVERRSTPGRQPHTVDAIYSEVIGLISREDLIPDEVFREDAYAGQPDWDAWGRGYRPKPTMLTPEGDIDEDAESWRNIVADERMNAMHRRATVLVLPAATRTEAVAALRLISEQGEAMQLGAQKLKEPSHFDRFLEIYQDFRKVRAVLPGFRPSRKIADNPTARKETSEPVVSPIGNATTRLWALLFNQRYRMLLAYLAHALRTERPEAPRHPDAAAMLPHRVFAEMYNLKAIATLLVDMPRCEPPLPPDADGALAGPPFELPYDMNLPPATADAWRMHLSLIENSMRLAEDLAGEAAGAGRDYLKTLLDLDRATRLWLSGIIGGHAMAGEIARR